MCFSVYHRSDRVEGTYGKEHGYGQEHEQVSVAESSTCASVAIRLDPSRVACFTSTADTILTTMTDENRPDHDALESPIAQVLFLFSPMFPFR